MIIATRELTAICKSGEKKPVVLRLEAPVQEDGGWRCWYEIDFPEDGGPAQTRRSYAAGDDTMQAIQLGLMKLGTELHFTSYHKEHKLFWDEGQEGSYGLIVPKNARDLLRGDDVTYYGN
mgnify:CR=1 FL=1|jgi:hypothetical protein